MFTCQIFTEDQLCVMDSINLTEIPVKPKLKISIELFHLHAT